MTSYHTSKHKKMQEILSIIKFGSMLFSSVIVLKLLNNDNSGVFLINRFIIILIPVLIVTFLYIFWNLFLVNRVNSKVINVIEYAESFVLFSVFVFIIFISGLQTSNYKYMFLFVIIVSAIQSGLVFSCSIAAAASLFLLGADLLISESNKITNFFENDLTTSIIFLLTAWALGFYVKLENEHIRKLEGIANIDGLTGLFNHRYFYDELNIKFKQFKEDKQPISLIFMDIDFFKQYNDLFGHQRGDEILRQVGALLRGILNDNMITARYGGDEFSVILINMTEKQAYGIAEKIRRTVEQTYFEGEENLTSHKLTFSIGIAIGSDDINSDVELIKCADDALYRAKFFFKNRVEVYSSILQMLKTDIEEEHIDLITSIKTLISVINAKDRYTYAHTERVVMYSKMLAEKLSLNEQEKKNLFYGAYMHDIGKIGISEQILNKKMPLTKEEWEIIKEHPMGGVNIIKPVKSLKDIAPLILHHHENYDGTGYPHNLKGAQIPFLARILTVADSFDAMTSERPYGSVKTFEEGLEELKIFSGKRYDPEIVKVFVEIIEENKLRIRNYKNSMKILI